MSKKNAYRLAALAVLAIASVLIIRQQRNMPYQHDQGMIFGTFYSITYQHDKSLQHEIEEQLQLVDNSLSVFNKSSVVTAVNNNKPVELTDMFRDVFALAQEVSDDTGGCFDITVAPLVNAWGFGFKNGAMPDAHAVDSLKSMIGYRKVAVKGGRVVKEDQRTMLDFSAIAKGYGSDVVAKYLLDQGIKNFMIEIGGEIVTRGVSPKRQPWAIGVERPSDDTLATKSELQTVLNITDVAMATSGNYRNFYYKNGKKYAHTINPQTGYPVQHNILSATVICKQCARADAYATAFMVMGLDKAKEVLGRHPEMKAYLIYDDHGKYGVWKSEGL